MATPMWTFAGTPVEYDMSTWTGSVSYPAQHMSSHIPESFQAWLLDCGTATASRVLVESLNDDKARARGRDCESRASRVRVAWHGCSAAAPRPPTASRGLRAARLVPHIHTQRRNVWHQTGSPLLIFTLMLDEAMLLRWAAVIAQLLRKDLGPFASVLLSTWTERVRSKSRHF